MRKGRVLLTQGVTRKLASFKKRKRLEEDPYKERRTRWGRSVFLEGKRNQYFRTTRKKKNQESFWRGVLGAFRAELYRGWTGRDRKCSLEGLQNRGRGSVLR